MQRAKRAIPKAVAIVPARLGSTRLPNKMLLRDTGSYLFEHTCRNVERSGVLERLFLATDSPLILAAAQEVGIEALLTSAEHASGTDRVREAWAILRERGVGPWDVVLDVQGDEPELPPADVASLVRAFADPEVEIATLAAPVADPSEIEDPNLVKVVTDRRGDALYFSRSVIPHQGRARVESRGAWKRHLGVYAFRPEALERFCALERGELERLESLEQLRWLEAGGKIRVLPATRSSAGIDTAENYSRFVARASGAR